MVSNIDEQDVLAVAKNINLNLTDKQVNDVLHLYQHEEECDPTGNWDLIVENCIYQVING
jgi:uncharacterized protein YpuA (DUF1002 family)